MAGLGDDEDYDDGMHAAGASPAASAAVHRYGTRGASLGGGILRTSMDERDDGLRGSGGVLGSGGGRPRSNSRVSVGKVGGGVGALLLPSGDGGASLGASGGSAGGRARTMSRGGVGAMADGLPAAPGLAEGGGTALHLAPPLRGGATRETSNGALTDLDTDEHVADALAMLGAAAVVILKKLLK